MNVKVRCSLHENLMYAIEHMCVNAIAHEFLVKMFTIPDMTTKMYSMFHWSLSWLAGGTLQNIDLNLILYSTYAEVDVAGVDREWLSIHESTEWSCGEVVSGV